MSTVPGKPVLDRSLAELLKPDWEKAFYVPIALMAVLSRFWDLGARAMSFDECTHALYSYYLYHGQGFTHNPLMHGPFLFHANALVYFLFGDSDFTARIVPALFGCALVLSPLLLRRWLGRFGAMSASVLFLISPSLLFYSRYIRNDIYIALWMVLLTAAMLRFLEDRNPRWFVAGAAVLMLSLATKENAYFFAFFGLVFLLQVHFWQRSGLAGRIALCAGGVLLGVLLLVAGGLLGAPPSAGDGEAGALSPAVKLLDALLTVLGGTLLAAAIAAPKIGTCQRAWSQVQEALRALSRRRWLMAGLVVLAIYVLLFTTVFTQPWGLVSGIAGSLSYWLEQQEVNRGGQPWYYYGLLLVMYEFLPLLLGLVAIPYYLLRGEAADPARGLPQSACSGEERAQPPPGACSGGNLLLPFLIFWTLASLFIYAWAAEKMPWLVVPQVVPLVLLAGRLCGEGLARLSARGWPLLRAVWLLPVGGLVLLTLRFAWMAAYVNYDYATELLVYAHAGVDVKPTMEEIAEISRRTAGDRLIEVSYDSEAAWPLEWYMREFPNHRYYGTTPNRASLSVPVVIASMDIDSEVLPYLGDRYWRFRRRQLWWPNQQYMDLSWQRVREIVGSAERRAILADILFWRKYPKTADDWYHVDYMYVYVRKDVAEQVWGWGSAIPSIAEPIEDRYADLQVDLEIVRTWGESGSGPGQFNHPRGIDAGPDGTLYVVDSDNSRVQVFGPDGGYLFQWGSACNLEDGQGCRDPDGDGPLEWGDGQFREPWGIGVGPDGAVYVADTWNHRIQAFGPDGSFLTKWGTFGLDSAGDSLYGPRDVLVDGEGHVYVTDTGNKRVRVYDGQGVLMYQWGGLGLQSGQFDEPVGLALDSFGRLFVADTWNQRVQAFDKDSSFLWLWPVDGWWNDSLANKPYLAADSHARVYLTDPEGCRIIVFQGNGTPLATFGQCGGDSGSLSLPTGIEVGAEGGIYVTDTDHQRVVQFEPLP